MSTDTLHELASQSTARPASILMDFDGIITATREDGDWISPLSTLLSSELEEIGEIVTPESLRPDLAAAQDALSSWGNAMARPWAPLELPAAEFWGSFVAADWSERQRDYVTSHAERLTTLMMSHKQSRTLNPGIKEFLELARSSEIPVAIVSNAMAGSVPRSFLEENSLSEYFVEQIYSNEVGVRKPNPEILELALERLGCRAKTSWFIGDRPDRDALCAHRAGIGLSIIVLSPDTRTGNLNARSQPDLTLEDTGELVRVLEGSLSPGACAPAIRRA